MKPSLPSFPACIFFFTLLLLSLQAALSQDFSSLDRDMAELENLIQDTLRNSEAQQK
jgi:hypothetical protein